MGIDCEGSYRDQISTDQIEDNLVGEWEGEIIYYYYCVRWSFHRGLIKTILLHTTHLSLPTNQSLTRLRSFGPPRGRSEDPLRGNHPKEQTLDGGIKRGRITNRLTEWWRRMDAIRKATVLCICFTAIKWVNLITNIHHQIDTRRGEEYIYPYRIIIRVPNYYYRMGEYSPLISSPLCFLSFSIR